MSRIVFAAVGVRGQDLENSLVMMHNGRGPRSGHESTVMESDFVVKFGY